MGRGNGQDFGSKSTKTVQHRIALRGSLAATFIEIREKDPVVASKWIRNLAGDALKGHPQVGYKIVPSMQYGEVLILGLISERGTMQDW